MKEEDMLLDASEFEKATAATFALLIADTGSETLRQKLIQHQSTIQQHQRQFAEMMAQKAGERNPV